MPPSGGSRHDARESDLASVDSSPSSSMVDALAAADPTLEPPDLYNDVVVVSVPAVVILAAAPMAHSERPAPPP